MIFVDATLDPSRFDASPQRLAMLEGAIGELGRAFQRFGRGLRKRRRRAGDRNGLTAASPAAERAVRERAGHAEEPDGGQGDGLQAVDSGGGPSALCLAQAPPKPVFGIIKSILELGEVNGAGLSELWSYVIPSYRINYNAFSISSSMTSAVGKICTTCRYSSTWNKMKFNTGESVSDIVYSVGNASSNNA